MDTPTHVPLKTVKELCDRAFGAGSTFALVKERGHSRATYAETFELWWEHTVRTMEDE